MPFLDMKIHEALERITGMLIKLLVQRVCKEVSNLNHLLIFEYVTFNVSSPCCRPSSNRLNKGGLL